MIFRQLYILLFLICPLYGQNPVLFYDNESHNGYVIPLTVDSAHISSGGLLQNFTVCVDLSCLSAADFWNHVKRSDGLDIFVTKPDGTVLDKELVFVDLLSGKGELYFCADSLSKTIRSFRLCFGGPEIYLNSVYAWDSHYIAVLHLQENPASPAPQFYESTLNHLDGYARNLSVSDNVEGKIGKCVSFNGGNKYITIPASASLNMSGNKSYTLESFIKPSDLLEQRFIAGRCVDSPYVSPYVAYGMLLRSDGKIRGYLYNTLSGSSWYPGAPVTANQWTYCVAVANGNDSTKSVYNNAVKASLSYYPVFLEPLSTPFNIAASSSGGDSFNGLIDEIRLSDIPRSDSWLITTYNNLNAPASFCLFGPMKIRAR